MSSRLLFNQVADVNPELLAQHFTAGSLNTQDFRFLMDYVKKNIYSVDELFSLINCIVRHPQLLSNAQYYGAVDSIIFHLSVRLAEGDNQKCLVEETERPEKYSNNYWTKQCPYDASAEDVSCLLKLLEHYPPSTQNCIFDVLAKTINSNISGIIDLLQIFFDNTYPHYLAQNCGGEGARTAVHYLWFAARATEVLQLSLCPGF